MITRKLAAASAALIIFAALASILFGRYAPIFSHDAKTQQPLPTIKSESSKIWACPMHPEISPDHPGVCPICGMKLVGAGNVESHDHGIHVDNATTQRLGIRVAKVKNGLIAQELQTYGTVVADESAVYAVHTRYEGWIKKLYVHAVGDSVKAGQVLYEIYSPELITRQRTYLGSVENRRQLLKSLTTTPDTENEYVMDLTMDAAKDRSRLHQEEGVSIETIQNIEETKQARDVVKIVSEHSGVVTQINVKEGSMVSQSAAIMTLSDSAQLWIDVPLFPDQAEMVRVGDSVTVSGTPSMPTIEAKINFISPLADANKVHARIFIDNRKYHLRAGMFTNLSIHSKSHEALTLPRSAIIYTAHGNMVMLSRGDGHFLPVHVVTGVEEGEWVELLDGLHEGTEVAVNGQFLLDAASSMSAASERMGMQTP